MRKVYISIGECASYEFNLEVPDDATNEQIAELAEAHFVATSITEFQCEVHSREVEGIDGETV